MAEKTFPLPPVYEKTLKLKHFPTKMQAVIFRNWDSVPKERIANCLGCDVKSVEKQAYKMGLKPQKDVSIWLDRGYLSIIKNNWHILPYGQILTLLEWDEERLAYTLKEEDFLRTKLVGARDGKKVFCEPVTYSELTEEEEKQTALIKKVMEEEIYETEQDKEPFAFFPIAEDAVPATPPTSFENKTVLDNTWFIEDKTGDEDVAKMLQRFERNMKNAWDVQFDGNEHKIVLSLSDDLKEEEAHKIEITENEITLTAKDCFGILRALTYLEDLAQGAGGPYFDRGYIDRTPCFKTRYIYSFCGLYNTALDTDSEVYCPDSLLESYAKVGINGIWLQGILYQLTEFPFEPALSVGWEKRLENLKKFSDRARSYGIKIYLYINEPRALPTSFFEDKPHLAGTAHYDYNHNLNGLTSLCTSTPEVQNYIKNGIKTICEYVPDLGGFFTITCSENRTNCYSQCHIKEITCPRCAKRKHYEVISEVSAIVAQAAHSVNPDIKVLAWDWAWPRNGYMNEEELKKCIELLPEDVTFMCVREKGMKTNIGGCKGEVDDYSMAVCGISELTRKEWTWAKESGHEIAAKVQINNTWECSTIPYLPVFALLEENIRLLKEEGVTHLMLSWTLGGYPSPNIKLVSKMFFDETGTLGKNTDILRMMYGDNAETIKRATDLFSEGFTEYPFDILTAYRGPSNGGAANLLFDEPTGLEATMTGYAMDDLDNWRQYYPEDIYENQYRLMTEKWAEGLKLLDDMEECDFKAMAESSYIQLKASYNQILFVRARNRGDVEGMIKAAEEEKKLASRLHRLMQLYPSIGFEASNHYYYTQNIIKEKIVNCEYLLHELRK